MSVMICSPMPNDTVTSPVTVVAAYSSAAAFNMTCDVGGTPESPPQAHTAGSDVHTSTPIAIAVPGSYTVSADGGVGPGLGSTSPVHVTNGTPPVFGVTATPVAPFHTGTRVAKTFHIKGECNPTVNAAYVICRVYEVNMSVNPPTMTKIAAGADTIKVAGGKHTWNLTMKFDADITDKRIQYMAQITAYDVNDTSLGTTTVFLKTK